MSSTLVWEPTHRKKHDLSDELKLTLRKRYDETIATNMDEHDIPYLEGLRDAGVEDADKLIEAIKKYGSIMVREQF